MFQKGKEPFWARTSSTITIQENVIVARCLATNGYNEISIEWA